MSILQNIVWSMPAMQILVGGIILAVITSYFILLTSLDKVPGPVAIFFALMAFDFTFVIHFLFKKVSIPCVESGELLEKLKSNERKSKWFTAFVRSCSPIKLSLGDGGFFDRLTSLVIWKFCMDQLITILLL